jgi:prolipoprotein diacylglyceryltransferase
MILNNKHGGIRLNKNQILSLSFKILGVYLIINNLISLLMVAATDFRILKNIHGISTFILSLTAYGIMLLLGIIFILFTKKLEQETTGLNEYQSFQRIMIGLLLMTSNFSSILYLISRTLGSYLGINNIISGDEEIYEAVAEALSITGLELCFLLFGFLIGMGFVLGWFKRLKLMIAKKSNEI